MMLQMPSIPSLGVNLVATSSHVEIIPMEKEHVREQAYPLIEVVHEGGVLHNNVYKDEEVQEMVTSQPNSHDQRSTENFPDTSMVDASHEETIIEANEFRAKNAQPNSVGDPNEV
jgi:uncharacterized membrane protein